MRKLAKALGVTPMAVYYYVSNKDALFEQVADAVLSGVPRPKPSGRDWQAELKACAMSGFHLLSQYPGLSGQIVKRPPTKQAEELGRYGIEILMAAGIDCNRATLATTLCQAFMFGMIGLQAQTERAQKRKRRATEGSTYLERVDVQRLAELGFDSLLAGLEQRFTSSSSGAPAKRSGLRAATTPTRRPLRKLA
jgi:AcrR family transcriptional regulator